MMGLGGLGGIFVFTVALGLGTLNPKPLKQGLGFRARAWIWDHQFCLEPSVLRNRHPTPNLKPYLSINPKP